MIECRRCKIMKPHSAFSKDRKRSKGLNINCRDCIKARDSKGKPTKPNSFGAKMIEIYEQKDIPVIERARMMREVCESAVSKQVCKPSYTNEKERL